jgi:hypothetical protein
MDRPTRPALLAQPNNRAMGVLNEAIAGGRLLHDFLGPNALARFDREVVAQSGRQKFGAEIHRATLQIEYIMPGCLVFIDNPALRSELPSHGETGH